MDADFEVRTKRCVCTQQRACRSASVVGHHRIETLAFSLARNADLLTEAGGCKASGLTSVCG